MTGSRVAGVALGLMLLFALAALRDQAVVDAEAASELTWRQHAILVTRERTHECTDELGRHRFRVEQRIITGGPPYRRWVLNLWRGRARIYCKAVSDARDPLVAIRLVFGEHAGAALRVARCESDYFPRDGVPDPHARGPLDEYGAPRLGMFQFGTRERRVYGHGPGALAQARAAYRYFVSSGRDWSPWSCRP